MNVEAHWQKALGRRNRWISPPSYSSPFLHLCKVSQYIYIYFLVQSESVYIFSGASRFSENVLIFFGISFSSVASNSLYILKSIRVCSIWSQGQCNRIWTWTCLQLTESHLRKHGWFLSITLDRSLPIGLDYSLLKAVNNKIVTNTTVVTKIDRSQLTSCQYIYSLLLSLKAAAMLRNLCICRGLALHSPSLSPLKRNKRVRIAKVI